MHAFGAVGRDGPGQNALVADPHSFRARLDAEPETAPLRFDLNLVRQRLACYYEGRRLRAHQQIVNAGFFEGLIDVEAVDDEPIVAERYGDQHLGIRYKK